MDNKRSTDRRSVFYYLEIFRGDTEELLGRLGDISNEGIMILKENIIPVGEVFPVKIALPQGFPGKEDYLTVTVEARWSKQDINPDIIRNGCKFVSTSHKEEEIIQDLITFYGFSDGHKQFKLS